MKAGKPIDKDELLVKYLAGEATAAEKAQAEHWISASAGNRQYYGHFKLIWDESLKLAGSNAIDKDKAWNRFRERLHLEYIAESKPKYNFGWLKIAAVILLISAAALFGPYFFKRGDQARYSSTGTSTTPVTLLTRVTTGHTGRVDLTDGSSVTLNKNSTLKYPATFNGVTRNVRLTGEAFFNVKHDTNKPFIIQVNDVLVTVLGTSFNVKGSANSTEVIVETGKVSLTRRQQVLTVLPGEKATAFISARTLSKQASNDRSYRAYLDNKPDSQRMNPTPTVRYSPNKNKALVQQILKNPGQWSKLLKNYQSQSNDIAVRRAVVRNVLDEIAKEKIVAGNAVKSFRLNENELVINDQKQSDAIFRRFKDQFIKEPGYTIYLGGAPKNGKGVYLQPDSL